MRREDAFALGLLDAHDQSALVRRGEVTGAELVEAARVRIAALDPTLRAVTCLVPEPACRSHPAPDADGPLAGVPLLLKDSLDYPGLPSKAGSASRGPLCATLGSPYTDRIQAAGLVVIGKSAMPEFGLLPVTEPLCGPVTRNPWSEDRSAGGSSGGSATAVAAGLVPLAHGSDGAGSIRIPASACGVVGLKPGRGATVRARARHVIEDLLVADSLIGRSARDVAAGFALARPEGGAAVWEAGRRRLRIAVSTRTLSCGAVDPTLVAATQRAADLCADLGHHVDWADPPIDGPAADAAERTLWAHIGADCVEAVRHTGQDLERVLEPWTLALARVAEGLPISALENAFRQLTVLPRQLGEFFQRYDVLLTPTLSAPPPRIGELAPTVEGALLMERMFGWLGFTPLQNLSGTPAISLPLHESGGLPAGVMFAGDRGREDVLLGLAFELEEALPWRDRWPALSVHGGALGSRS